MTVICDAHEVEVEAASQQCLDELMDFFGYI